MRFKKVYASGAALAMRYADAFTANRQLCFLHAQARCTQRGRHCAPPKGLVQSRKGRGGAALTCANLKLPLRRLLPMSGGRCSGGEAGGGSREAPEPKDASRLTGCSRLVPPPPRAPRGTIGRPSPSPCAWNLRALCLLFKMN